MRNIFVVIFMAMLLGACGKSDTNQAPAVQSDSTPKQSRPIAAPEDDKGVDKLAAMGLALEFPHEINYDILDQSNSGTTRHRVLVEVLEADFPTALQQFEASIIALGYAKKDEVDDDGKIKITYSKKDRANLYIIAQPVEVGPSLKNSDSSGSIHIMWRKGK
ncbi:hypothetical protein ACW7G0_00865 [Lysobacter sp. A286]